MEQVIEGTNPPRDHEVRVIGLAIDDYFRDVEENPITADTTLPTRYLRELTEKVTILEALLPIIETIMRDERVREVLEQIDAVSRQPDERSRIEWQMSFTKKTIGEKVVSQITRSSEERVRLQEYITQEIDNDPYAAILELVPFLESAAKSMMERGDNTKAQDIIELCKFLESLGLLMPIDNEDSVLSSTHAVSNPVFAQMLVKRLNDGERMNDPSGFVESLILKIFKNQKESPLRDQTQATKIFRAITAGYKSSLDRKAFIDLANAALRYQKIEDTIDPNTSDALIQAFAIITDLTLRRELSDEELATIHAEQALFHELMGLLIVS